jgi:hypothetical protein
LQLTLLLTSEARLLRVLPKFWAAEPRLDVKGSWPFNPHCNKEELPLELPKGIPSGAYAPCTEVKLPPEKVAVWKYACETPEPTCTGLLNPN